MFVALQRPFRLTRRATCFVGANGHSIPAITTMTSTLPPNWTIPCSDDEDYFESSQQYRHDLNGTRIWEPTGDDITRLYGEIESNGFNKLDWQCPGRLSPSQLNQSDGADKDTEAHENDTTNSSNLTKSKFDFDSEFDEDGFSSNPNNTKVTKRTQLMKKSQTDLSKVMFDIKKYQKIDQKNTKVKSSTASPAVSIATNSNATSKETKNSNFSIESNEHDEMDFS